MLSFISKIFGSKSDRDLKDIRPIVDEIHAATSKIQSLSNDQLRQKTIDFKNKIKDATLEEENKILSLKEKAELPETDLSEKEDIYADIDKLKKEIKVKIKNTLDEILPEAFAVIKETAKRFKENENIEVTASAFDKELASKKKINVIGGDGHR